MARLPDTDGKFVLILRDVSSNPYAWEIRFANGNIEQIRGNPRISSIDYRHVKDFIRAVTPTEPGTTNIVASDPATSMTDFNTWDRAFQAFNILNGYYWNGIFLDAILQYPDRTTWLIHPRTDPTASVPLVRRYRSNSGLGYTFITPQPARGRRNSSISSLSSQTSSQGGPPTPSSLSSMGSAGLTPPYELLTPSPVVVDTTSGEIVPRDVAPSLLSSSQVDGSGRYQSFLHISGASAYTVHSPPRTVPRPRYLTEQRKVLIRQLSLNVTDRGLRGLLQAQNLATPTEVDIRTPESNRCTALLTFTTAAEAREAVRRLNNYRFMDRTLGVALAREESTVGYVQRPIIADGSD